MVSRWKKIAATMTTAALLSVGAQQCLAQDHGHAHEADGPARLSLNKGQKWATDANLRLGMSRIREAMAADLAAIHGGKATVQQYRALAQKINEQIAFMVQACKLEPEADAMLHLLLADIIAGADAMRDKGVGEARKGAEKIAHALGDYGVYFSHPGWHGLTQSH